MVWKVFPNATSKESLRRILWVHSANSVPKERKPDSQTINVPDCIILLERHCQGLVGSTRDRTGQRRFQKAAMQRQISLARFDHSMKELLQVLIHEECIASTQKSDKPYPL